MFVFLFRSCFDKVDMTSAAYKDSTAGAALELMVMSVAKICAEANLMHMVIAAADRNGFTAYSRKAMVVSIIAASEDLRAAQYLVDMLLSAFVVMIPVTIAVTVAVTIAVTVAIPVTVAVTIAVTIAVTVAVAITVTIAVTIAVTVTIMIALFLLLAVRSASACHNGLEIHRNALLSE